MAKIGNNYEAEFENTEKQGGGGGILPHMYALLQAESIELPKTKDERGYQAEITFEVVEPEEFKGRKFWAYWTIVHPDGYQLGAYKYGKPMFDRFGRAVGEEITADTDTDDLLFKTFVAEVGIQIGNANPAGGFYKDKNQIERFFYNDANAKEPIPELGVIGDGTQGKKRNEDRPAAANDNRRTAASNDNKPAAAAAGGTGRKPWGSK
ncbi:hypothetical protein PCC82_11590 [Agrobacterium deltaense]